MAAQLESAGAPRTLQRPNILLLYTDQQRLDSLGCYGSPFASTPHLDALAAGGRRFARCYVQSPVCVPSRFAFLTDRRSALRGGARRTAPPVGRAAAAGALQRPSARGPLLRPRY